MVVSTESKLFKSEDEIFTNEQKIDYVEKIHSIIVIKEI